MYNKVDNKTWQEDAFMDKEKILELSRKENKNQDIYEKEVLVTGNKYSCIVAAILALILCISLDKKFTLIKYPIGCLFFALPQVKMNICIEYSLKYTFYAKSSVKNEYSLFLHICIFIHILKIYVEIKVDFAVKTLGFI